MLITDELEELLEIPDDTDEGILEREKKFTEAGKVYTGRARKAINIHSKYHEEQLLKWSLWRNTQQGSITWNEIPIYVSIPKLHKCRKCELEGRPFIGHDVLWCRIKRNIQQEEQPQNPLEANPQQEEAVPLQQEEAVPLQPEEEVPLQPEKEVPQQEEEEVLLQQEVPVTSETMETAASTKVLSTSKDNDVDSDPSSEEVTNETTAQWVTKTKKRKRKKNTSNPSTKSFQELPKKKTLNTDNNNG